MYTIYSTETCPWCQRAKVLLDKRGFEYHEIDITTDRALQKEMLQRSGRQSVPQIFIGDKHVGGYDDLVKYLQNAEAA
jgi:glutaredoxin 3